MAKASEVSDSEEPNAVVTSPKKSASNTVEEEAAVEVASEAENGEDNEEEQEEYEIEEIRDAKRGYFPGGRIGYLVKWKGYQESENSWVDEADAENAGDLVKEFWQKRERVKVARKATDGKSPKRSRKSVAADDLSDAAATTTAPKKRGRKPANKEDSDEDMEKDKPESASARATKKARKNTTEKSPDKPKRKAQSTASTRTASPIPVERDEVAMNMAKYMNQDNWEDLIATVDTVERVGKELFIYFSLSTGERVRETSALCKTRFPQKLLDFYEGNLRWRTAEDA